MAEADHGFGEQNTGATAPVYSLDQVINAALALGLPVAAWRLPLTTETKVYISFDKDLEISNPDLENSASGFLFSPFIVGELPTVFIKAAVVYSSETGHLQFSNAITEAQKQEFIVALDKAQTINYTWHLHTAETINQQTEAGFKTAVAKAIESIPYPPRANRL